MAQPVFVVILEVGTEGGVHGASLEFRQEANRLPRHRAALSAISRGRQLRGARCVPPASLLLHLHPRLVEVGHLRVNHPRLDAGFGLGQFGLIFTSKLRASGLMKTSTFSPAAG